MISSVLNHPSYQTATAGTGVAAFTQSYSDAGKWAVFEVRTSAELSIVEALRSQGFSATCPFSLTRRIYRRRAETVRSPIYPGYVFAAFHDEVERHAIRMTRGVVKTLLVHETQQDALVRQLASLERMLSTDPYLEALDWARDGVPVRVISGPLVGVSGRIIRRRDHDVLIVGVETLGRVVECEIDRACIEQA
jgi:transcriptional antiterminator RfaH